MAPKYSPLDANGSDTRDSESAAMLSDDAVFEKLPGHTKRRKWNTSNIVHWGAHFLSVLILFGLLLRANLRDAKSTTTEPADKPKSQWTPADEALGDELSHTTIFKNSFWKESPYKGPPTPEILERWHHLTMTGPVNVTASEMKGLNLSLDAVQFPKEYGGGYVGFLESAHQLHCLQAIWEDHHWNTKPHLRHLFPTLKLKLETEPEITEAHFEHCVDVIRNRLMCTADAQLVTFRWVQKINRPYPYFDTQHQCRSYEGLLEWDKARRPGSQFPDGYPWEKPEGVVELEKAP